METSLQFFLSQPMRRFHYEDFILQACNLFCLLCRYISPQLCQAGLWSAITLKNNRTKGHPQPFSERDRGMSGKMNPALPPPVSIGWNICWLCRFWRVIYCQQQQSGSLDTFSLGLSKFYGYHVLTAKLCLRVSLALEVNVKQLGMEGGLWGRPMCFPLATNLFSDDVCRVQQGEAVLQLVPECQLKIVMNPITGKRSWSF